MTAVVNLTRNPGGVAAVRRGEYVYVGRAVPRLRLPASKWANPFRIGRDGDRAEVISKYTAWLAGQDHLDPGELAGRVLACWCAPLPCHGHVLAAVAGLRESISGEEIDRIHSLITAKHACRLDNASVITDETVDLVLDVVAHRRRAVTGGAS